jgi:4-hydroxy-tetrahydrodipicolinate synthase
MPSRFAPEVLQKFRGVAAAIVCPMDESLRIDETSLEHHVREVLTGTGIAGLLVNGHAGEGFLLSSEERARVIRIVREVAGPSIGIVAGINDESSARAAADAANAEAAGADGVLVFPCFSWALSRHPRSVMAHHETIGKATGLPMLVYAASVNAGALKYEAGLMEDLVRLPTVIGVKEGSWDSAHYEANLHLMKSIDPEFLVLASGDEHLLSCFLFGTDGSQVSIATIVPEATVALYDAVKKGDLTAARRAHDVIYPLAKYIYGAWPGNHAVPRLKTCLKLLGRLPSDAARPPFQPLDGSEVAGLTAALRAAKVLH